MSVDDGFDVIGVKGDTDTGFGVIDGNTAGLDDILTGTGCSIPKVFSTDTGLSIGNVLEMLIGRSIGNVFCCFCIGCIGLSMGNVAENDLADDIFEDVNDVKDLVVGTAKSPNSSSRSIIELG